MLIMLTDETKTIINFEKVKIEIEVTLKVKQDGREGEPTDFLIWKEGDQEKWSS